METYHNEDQPSPFIVKDDDASLAAMISLADDDFQYAGCPVEGCGEAILLTELDSHIDMHGAEEQEAQERPSDDFETNSEDEPEPKKPKLAKLQASFGTKLSHALRNLDDNKQSSSESPPSESQAKAKSQWKGILKMPELARASKMNGFPSTEASQSSNAKRRLGVSLSYVLERVHHVITILSI